MGKNKNRNKSRKRKEDANMLQGNKDPENPGTRQEMSCLDRMRRCFCRLMSYPLFCLDVVISIFIWIQIFLYRKIAKKEPLYLMGKELAVNETIRNLQELRRLQRKFEDLMIDYQNKQSEIEHLQYNLREAVQETIRLQRENDELTQRFQRNIDDLKTKIAFVSREKDDALRRLSEVVSVKLRDNNPNIVDLNDACRPTKLAEMFSELYDNEWTSAFALLEKHFTEVQAVVILLDTVMEAYYCCEKKLEESWQILSKWFLNTNLTGSQQTVKWLKDSRKSFVLDKLEEVNEELEELLLSVCKIPEVGKILMQKPVQFYKRKCIELCLLMVTTDPSVVLGCPGWIPSKPLTKEEKAKLKAIRNRTTVEKMRKGSDADKMTQQYDENTAAPETSNAEHCTPNKDSAVKPDQDSADGTKHTEEVEEEKSEEENDESNSISSYDMLKDLKQTCNNHKQLAEVQKTISKPPKGNKIGSYFGKKETLSTSFTDPLDAHPESDVHPVGEAAQSEGDGAKQESKNIEVELLKREDEETLQKDEAEEEGEEEQQDINGQEAAIKEDSKEHADSGKTEEEEEHVERQQFAKDMFKEYTTRGKYLDFVVWPAMYLHKGGPLLGKGVAQGTKEQKRKARQQVWSWRNVDA